MRSPSRTVRSRASPSKSTTPWVSTLGAMGSLELHGAQQPTSPTRSIGTTSPGHGTRGAVVVLMVREVVGVVHENTHVL